MCNPGFTGTRCDVFTNCTGCAGALSFSTNTGVLLVLEGAVTANVTVVRTGGSVGAVAAQLSFAAGRGNVTAADFTSTLPLTVSFLDGQTTANVSIQLAVDSAEGSSAVVWVTNAPYYLACVRGCACDVSLWNAFWCQVVSPLFWCWCRPPTVP